MSLRLKRVSTAAIGLVFAPHGFATDAGAGKSGALEEIVVTAQRVESSASRTPISLTAVTGTALTEEGISNPTLMAAYVPNLNIDRANGLQITIRGVTSTDGTEKGDPSASFLLDGIYIARPQAQEVSFLDIDRVEVLRGPQGTLYGRNTTAGVINVISNKPGFDFAAAADLAYGNYSTVQASGMINLPVNDMLALRAAVSYDARDTFVRPGVAQAVEFPKDKDNTSGRLSALFKPMDALSLLLRFDAARIRGSNTQVQMSNFWALPFTVPDPGSRGVDPTHRNRSSSDYLSKNYADDVPNFAHDSTWGISSELNWRLLPKLNFTWLGSYREFSRDEGQTFFLGVVPPASNIIISAPDTFTGKYYESSHELRIAYATERITAQAGFYYFKERYGIDFLLYGLNNPTPGQVGYIFGFPQRPGGQKSTGEFSQVTYSLLDPWRITAGVRNTHDDKYRIGATINHGAAADPFNPATDSLNDADLSTSKVTWKLGTDFDLKPDALLYATASTGYKQGGFNDGCAAGQRDCLSPLPLSALYYKPETITAYEAGVKSTLIDKRLRLTADYFHYDYKDLQLSQISNVCGGPCQVTTNAAAAKVDGLEAEGLFAPDVSNRLQFSFTWLDARYADWPIVPGFNFRGAKLDRSPEFTVSAGYSHTFHLSNGSAIAAELHSFYSDRYSLLYTGSRSQFWQPGFTKTDLNVTYRAPADRWYLQAFVKNVEDNINVTSIGPSAAYPGLTDGVVNFGDPRTWGVRTGVKF